ncbi:MAG: BPTI/Kunitz-type proteinase inhibitor domain-containing protein [Crocinitomicaceae bacterium]
MKNKIAILAIILLSTLSACNKIIKCDAANLTCTETAPTGELCEAYFTRWFFDASTNSCQEIGYNGCSEKGFATKIDCENCICVSIH